MNNQQKIIQIARNKFVETRKILCTGNPDNPTTLASGIRKIYPGTTFIHRSAGWDLANLSKNDELELGKLFSQHNTFINASFIAPFVQSKLLTICNNSVKFHDVVNIGSTHEYDGLGHEKLTESKLDLRNISLKLNTFRFKTHHIVLGGINRGLSPDTQDWLDIDTICNIIPWLFSQPFNVPIIGIDQFKAPW